MKSRSLITISVTLAIIAACLFAVVGTRSTAKATLLHSKPKSSMTPASFLKAFQDGSGGDPDPTPFFPVSVDPTLNLDANTNATYQSFANLLSGSQYIPQDRLNYYAAVNDPPDWHFSNFSGCVTNVQPNADGNLVTVKVFVNLSSSAWGPVTGIKDAAYFEQYQFDVNNNMQYSGFLDPNGNSGKMFTSFVGL